jgi:hypothetical protein
MPFKFQTSNRTIQFSLLHAVVWLRYCLLVNRSSVGVILFGISSLGFMSHTVTVFDSIAQQGYRFSYSLD